jgi:SAM-dependent methyltransferase
MDSEFPCPVCRQDRWRELESHRFSPAEHRNSGSELSAAQRLRRRILFEVWAPGEDEITLRTRVCTACGFVAFSPRPTEAEIAAKYRFLQRTEPDIGGSGSERARSMDRARADLTYRFVRESLGGPPDRVLDFGGGDGKILRPFVERGVDCSIVDYNEAPIEGVNRLGETLESVPEGKRFDAIVCSHVLEHLGDPAAAVQRLSELVTPDGIVFSEVPVEIWNGIPIERDPVTHVNFFTAASLRELHARNGFAVLDSRELLGSYGEFRKEVAVVIARPAGEGARRGGAPGGDSLAETMKRIAPSHAQRVRHAWRLRRAVSPRERAARLKRKLLPR